eukprot:jgi/Botrbrau1/3491/Bobra.341_2s0021.1
MRLLPKQSQINVFRVRFQALDAMCTKNFDFLLQIKGGPTQWGPWQVAAPTCYAFKMIINYFNTCYTALISRFPWYCHGWTRMAMLMAIPCPHVMPHKYILLAYMAQNLKGPAYFFT